MRFLHVMLRVKDIEKSLNFYQNLFDMNLVNTIDLEDARLYFLADNDGQTQIELTYNYEVPKDGYTEGSKFGHLAFQVDSIADFSLKMQELCLGSVQDEDIYEMEEHGMKIAFISDPDANNIELIEYTY